MKRCFVSIDIPEEFYPEIKKIQDQLPEFYGPKTDLKNLHLTLKFLGDIDDYKLEEVKERLREINFEDFEASIDSIGIFDNRSPRKYRRKIIIWLQLKGCGGLQKKIDECLEGLFDKERRFMAHLTIARAKAVKNKKQFVRELEQIEIPEMQFVVDNFTLKESFLIQPGPRYELIEEYESENKRENIT